MTQQVGEPWPFGLQPQLQPLVLTPVSPRTMPVNVPFSTFGVTIVTMDRDGNITIKVDQTGPSEPAA